MKKLLVSVTIGLAVVVGMVVGNPLAASASPSQDSARARMASLEARVASLERRVRLLGVFDLTANQEILNLQNRDITSSEFPGGVTIVQPLSWGTAIGGVCLNGAPVGATFHTDYPAEVGTVTRNGEVHVFNPSPSRSLVLNANVVCATIK